MINLEIVRDVKFETLIKNFDERIDYLKTQFNIELKTYGNILRIALNTIQPEICINLAERVHINREMERALDIAGGYTLDFIGQNNPKMALSEIIRYLKDEPLKLNRLVSFLQNDRQRKTVFADTNDIEFLQQKIRNHRISILSLSEIKKKDLQNETVLFYSFNGAKDFDYIYNLSANITLTLYEQEYQLYQKQLQKRKQQIED